MGKDLLRSPPYVLLVAYEKSGQFCNKFYEEQNCLTRNILCRVFFFKWQKRFIRSFSWNLEDDYDSPVCQWSSDFPGDSAWFSEVTDLSFIFLPEANQGVCCLKLQN